MENISLHEEIERLQDEFAILRHTNTSLLKREKLRVSVINLQREALNQNTLYVKDRCRSIQCIPDDSK